MTAPVSQDRTSFTDQKRRVATADECKAEGYREWHAAICRPRPEDDTPVILTVRDVAEPSTLGIVRKIMQLSGAEYCTLCLHLELHRQYTSVSGLWSVRLP